MTTILRTVAALTLTAVSAAGVLAQQTVHMTINVADPSKVTAFKEIPDPVMPWMTTQEPLEVVQGANVFDFEIGEAAVFEPVGNNVICPAVMTIPTSDGGTTTQNIPVYMGVLAIPFYPMYDNATTTVTAFDPATDRTTPFTVTVDNPDKVTLTYADGAGIELTAGENTVMFADGCETTLKCSPTAGNNIYQVLVDGEPLNPGGSNFTIPLTAGGSVQIIADYPDLPANLNFSYDSGAEGIVDALAFDGVPVQDFDGTTATGRLGQQFKVTLNISDYILYNVKVNGQDEFVNKGVVTGTLKTADTSIEVFGHLRQYYDVTVKVTNPDHIKLYEGYYSQQNTIYLDDTVNEIELAEDENGVSWEAITGARIISVKLNGQPFEDTRAWLQNGDVLEFETEMLTLDKKAVIWFDDRFSPQQFNVTNGLGQSMAATLGAEYNEVDFCDAYNPVKIHWQNSTAPFDGALYVNGELQTPTESWIKSKTYEITLNEGDVVKAFMRFEPVESQVTFSIPEGVECGAVRDLVVPVTAEELAGGFTAFNGTRVTVTVPSKYEVLLNGGAIASEGDVYEFTLDGPAAVAVARKVVPTSVKLVFNGMGAAEVEAVQDRPATIRLALDEYWTVEALSLNGGDVLAALSGNTYTTPALEGANILEVTAAYNGTLETVSSSSVGETPVGTARISMTDGKVVVTGLTPGDEVAVYSLNGMEVVRKTADNDTLTISLSPAAYIVRVNRSAVKVML